jgi:hypothetical protein
MKNEIVHDIVIGDFGRPATERYFSLISKKEREFILNQNSKQSFFDEKRRIQTTLVCTLSFIKKDILPVRLEDINETHLVGTLNGIDPHVILERLLNVICNYIKVVIRLAPNRIRIVLPCVTLSPLLRDISEYFTANDKSFQGILDPPLFSQISVINQELAESNIKLTFPSITDVVMQEIKDREIKYLKVIATKVGQEAWRDSKDRIYPKLKLEKRKLKDEIFFNNLYSNSIHGKVFDLKKLNSSNVLYGCTDLEQYGLLDIIEIYTRFLIKDAYYE